MRDQKDTSSDCSKECEYIFHECEADASPSHECRATYSECMLECEVD
jgi:hypothetical protein